MRYTGFRIGMGCCLLAVSLTLASTHGNHPLLGQIAKVLIVIGFALLVLHLWKRWQS